MTLATAILVAIALTLFVTAPFGKGVSLAHAGAENTPATGLPTISGTAQVGEMLTADTSGISDSDGLTDASYTYQWVRNDGAEDTDITGATSRTYTLVDADQGKTVKVRVSFIDDAGHGETLTSEPTAEVSEDYLLPDLVSDPPTRHGQVSVEVAPDGTELLALRFTGYVTNLGNGPLDLSGNPQLSDPADLTSHDVWQRALTTSGDWVQLTKPPVRYETADTHNHFHLMGLMAYSLWDETGTLQLRPSEKVGFCLVDIELLRERHSQPSVQRYEQSELRNCMRNEPDAQSLRMGLSEGWRDIYHREMVFQWVDVSDVTPGVYRIGVQADPNDVVVESDETNNGVALSETVSSVPGYVAESQVVKAQPGETVDIELTFRRYGSPDRRAHRIITAASNGTVTTEDNFRVTDSSGMEHSAFYSKEVQYTPQADFVGVDTFTFIAFDSRRPDYPINPTVATVTIVLAAPTANSPATGEPTITGTVQVGETLTANTSGVADADGLSSVQYEYQWLADDSEIAGATGATYTLTDSEEGKAIAVQVGFSDDAGHGETLTSAATGAVAARPNSLATGAPTLWSAIMTVERVYQGYGYSTYARTAGSLFPASFKVDGTTYTVKMVETWGWMYIGVDRELPFDFVLELNGVRFASNDASFASYTYGNIYQWAGTGLSWRDGDTVAVRLLRAPGDETAVNSAATGAPTISGTPQVGETLTASTSGIADADGLVDVSFTYQWLAGDTEIAGATGSTYAVAAADEGKAIALQVGFTDDAGHGETLTSAATGAVLGESLPGAPRNVSATAGDRTVSLSWERPAENGNPPPPRYRIEWRIEGQDYSRLQWGTSRDTTYTTPHQANLANGVKYFFRVKAENGPGYGPYGPTSEEVNATPSSGSAVDLGTPVLSDTEHLHHRMTRLDWQDIEDASRYVVQYYHIGLGGAEWLDLPAVGVDITFHGSSAVVSNLEYGIHWLRVGAASCTGESEWSQIEELIGTRASDWEGVPVPEVEEGDATIEPCPVVLGTPVLSEPENLHHRLVQLDWQDIEDAGWYVVQYYQLDGGSGEWVDLPAAGVDIAFHGSGAVVSNLEYGIHWLRVGAASCTGESEWSQIEELIGTRASDWEGVPVPDVAAGDEIDPCSEDADTPDNSSATGTPTISGTPRVGEVLEVDTSGIADAEGFTNAAFTYQWLADDSDIAGATGSTYTLTDSEEGKAIAVQVGFTDDADNEETLTSAATAAVAAKPTPNRPATGAPSISGTAQVRETLAAHTSGVADADGLRNVQYEYQWLADDSDIAGATNATYTLVAADEGKVISVSVSFTDDAGNEETLTSAATAAVAGAPPAEPPAKPRRLEATASHDSVTLTWDDPGDASITGYVILRRVRVNDTGGDFNELVADTASAATTYTDDTVAASLTYTYRIKAINGAGTSERSRWRHIDTPATPVPDQPTRLTATVAHGSVTLNWDDPGDDSITGYVILRRLRYDDPSGHFDELVADTGTAATSYTDETVAAGTHYTYRIKASNEYGPSERSRWLHIETPGAR